MHAVEICSVDDNGDYNKLGNRAFLKFTATAASHTLTMTKTSGPAARDPDFVVYKSGVRVQVSQEPVILQKPSRLLYQQEIM